LEPGYVFDMAWERERERLQANERYWDSFSTRILGKLGIADGMRVLDGGAGGGTIAQCFARHVAPSGSVPVHRFAQPVGHYRIVAPIAIEARGAAVLGVSHIANKLMYAACTRLRAIPGRTGAVPRPYWKGLRTPI
jgi:hypothetical protein